MDEKSGLRLFFSEFSILAIIFVMIIAIISLVISLVLSLWESLLEIMFEAMFQISLDFFSFFPFSCQFFLVNWRLLEFALLFYLKAYLSSINLDSFLLNQLLRIFFALHDEVASPSPSIFVVSSTKYICNSSPCFFTQDIENVFGSSRVSHVEIIYSKISSGWIFFQNLIVF